MSKLSRTLVRQVVPGFVSTLYYYYRCHCVVHPSASVQISRGIEFGRKTTVHRYSRIIIGNGRLVMGSECNIQSFTILAMGDAHMQIGNHVRIGPNCNLLAADHEFTDRDTPIIRQRMVSKGLRIEDNVWIGANCVVLPGLTVGTGSVVGAGSIVTKDVPEFAVVVGNPARVIRHR